MQQHCRTCKCESSGIPGTPGYMEGVELLDAQGNVIELNPYNPQDALKIKSPGFEVVMGQVLSPCHTVAMETKKDPSIAVCKACDQPVAQWNTEREGWDRYVAPVEASVKASVE